MANTLTSLIPTIYEALDIVSREQTGMIRAVARNTSAERAALNQSILVPVTQAQAAADTTPGVNAPDTGDQTVDNVQITISKSKHVPVRWNGEDTRGMLNAGTYNTVLRDQFAQGFRTLCGLIEVDLFSTYTSASRAVGTAGTAPFGTAGDLSDIALVRQILEDNGAPTSNLRFVGNSSAMANLRGKQSVLFKANEAGTDDLLREGILTRLEGFAIGSSSFGPSHTKGTGTSWVVNTAGAAIGAATIPVTTGSGTMLAGDILTFGSGGGSGTLDTNKYVLGTTYTSTSIALNKPSLRLAHVSADTITTGNSYRPNLAFDGNAIQLVTRAPAMPMGGDSASESELFFDEHSGLVFEVALYRQFAQAVFHVRIAWGWKAIKSEHIATVLG